MKTPIAFEWHNYETGHAYVDYIPRAGMTEKDGYTRIPLYPIADQEPPATNDNPFGAVIKEPKSDKDYLNEFIEKATPNLSKIKDVDQELAEIRGEEPSKGAEALISNYLINGTGVYEGMQLVTKSRCLKAMEQYHKEGLREELDRICDVISESLKSATLLNFEDDEGNKSQLKDYLSIGETVKTGNDEIENLVEQIYFGLDEYLKQKP